MMALIVTAMAATVHAQDDDLPVIQSRAIQMPKEIAPVEDPGYVPPANIVVGMAEARIERAKNMAKKATLLAEAGGVTVRVESEDIQWGRMQRSAKKKIDFDDLDAFVLTYQNAGFGELVVPLSSHSDWASVDCRKSGCSNQTPKLEYMDLYAAWITAVVERYDADGVADMPGLRVPVRIFEIGDAFTAAEPGPVADYLQMLSRAYEAAHAANQGVLIAHAAFVTTTVFGEAQQTGSLGIAFATAGRLLHHSLSDVRAVLDAPQSFDVVNLHALSSPGELEATLEWVQGEMQEREYEKPIFITRATPSPFITGGAATSCSLLPDAMGVLVPPSDEEDRCRLVSFFNLLLQNNQLALSWLHKYAAADLIKKVVVAAEQGAILINAGVMEDDEDAQSKGFQAANGTTAWVGMIGSKARRPAFMAMDQVVRLTRGYTEIRRLPTADPRIFVYRVKRNRGTLYVAWAEPGFLTLPGDGSMRMEIDLPVDVANIVVERMISQAGRVQPPRKFIIPRKGMITVTLTPQPAFIFGAY